MNDNQRAYIEMLDRRIRSSLMSSHPIFWFTRVTAVEQEIKYEGLTQSVVCTRTGRKLIDGIELTLKVSSTAKIAYCLKMFRGIDILELMDLYLL